MCWQLRGNSGPASWKTAEILLRKRMLSGHNTGVFPCDNYNEMRLISISCRTKGIPFTYAREILQLALGPNCEKWRDVSSIFISLCISDLATIVESLTLGAESNNCMDLGNTSFTNMEMGPASITDITKPYPAKEPVPEANSQEVSLLWFMHCIVYDVCLDWTDIFYFYKQCYYYFQYWNIACVKAIAVEHGIGFNLSQKLTSISTPYRLQVAKLSQIIWGKETSTGRQTEQSVTYKKILLYILGQVKLKPC